MRLGARGTAIALVVVAVQSLFGATQCAGFFANDIATTHLSNYWFYMVTLSVVGMALATHFTERKQTGAALQESEAKYRLLIESLQEGIWVIDKEANTSFVNLRMAQMLGYSVEEMQGRHLFSFMDERGKEIATQNLERRKQGIREQHDFELLRKDGSRIYTSMATSPILDEAGNYAGALAGVTDITERKRVECKLRDLAAHLQTVREEEKPASRAKSTTIWAAR